MKNNVAASIFWLAVRWLNCSWTRANWVLRNSIAPPSLAYFRITGILPMLWNFRFQISNLDRFDLLVSLHQLRANRQKRFEGQIRFFHGGHDAADVVGLAGHGIFD